MQAPLRNLFLLCALAALSGCHPESTPTSDGMLIQWSSGMRNTALYLPLVALVAGLIGVRTTRFFVTGLFLLGFAFLCAPYSASFWTDAVVINEEEIYEYHGFPWDRQKRGFPLDVVQSVEIYKEHWERGGSDETYFRWFLCFGDHDADQSIFPSRLWERASEDILEHLEQHGIRLAHSEL